MSQEPVIMAIATIKRTVLVLPVIETCPPLFLFSFLAVFNMT